ncbi:GT2 family glycosyltransferase/SAM-dependent methyltransferase [Lysobacter niabensis]|uniref:GT2 family glycosyltransferase/SAM-dependent methyltransferase n=1 Tax=Agrilutibacter niabensis TaxID=380628 RepID=A0ABU1VU06_9GAMM|nr:glycoside hydrolase family 99-like domain-containing protein [Lysobacter niabensis]MDR7100820.1 GT2 family glycosyltransferase/SAM-dependent methyltransferase [Lysobacter niabensis]
MKQTKQLASTPQFPGYVYDVTMGFWKRQNEESFSYSDGDDVEQRLLAAVRGAGDKSLFSTELAPHQTDWASTYHLSPTRANLLRPLERVLTGASVLEVGAGCGAITRFLGEVGANVTALEGSGRRAAITAARCQDLDNVTVVSDRFDAADLPHKFDVVTLIGVLEYSRMYTAGEDPVQATLARALKLLNDDGVLVVAIENQLGLKYFAGMSEDHLGRPMAGIEDHYREDGVVTFGKVELERRLSNAGFARSEFALPFPDYKLPVSVVLPSGLRDESVFAASSIAGQAVRADRQLQHDTLFSMSQAFNVLGRNSLLTDLSNSFLVLAGKSHASPTFAEAAPDVLAAHYASGRLPSFTKASEFVGERDHIRVRRSRLCPLYSPSPSLLITQTLEDEDYIPGVHWGQALEAIVSRPGWTSDDVAQWLEVWLRALLDVAGIDANSPLNLGAQLPGKWFDATPRNLILGKDGPTFFDLEWISQVPLTLGFLVFRGLSDALVSASRIARPAQPELAHIPTLIRASLRKMGAIITQAQIESHYDAEASFQDETLGIIRRAPLKNSMDAYYLCIAPEVGALLKEGSTAIAEASRLSVELDGLREARDHALQQLEAERQHVHQLELRVGEIEGIHESTQSELAVQSAAAHQLNAELAQTRTEHERELMVRVQQLNEELARAHAEHKQELQVSVQQLNAELAQARALHELELHARAQHELELLQRSHAEVESHRAHAESLRVEIEAKEFEIHRLWGLLDEASGTGKHLEQLHNDANQRLADLHMALLNARDTEALAAHLTARLMQIEASKSWRFTAPLRFAIEQARLARSTARHLAYRIVEKIYRALPHRFALQAKGAIFSSTGGLLSRTRAYQRWRAELNMRAPAPVVTVTANDFVPATGAVVPELWLADGHREWSDYRLVRDRIDAEFAQRIAARKPPKPRRLIELGNKDVLQAARAIRLPDPTMAPDVSILVPAYNHLTTTLECLGSIAANVDANGPTFEVIVADDASTDETPRVLAEVGNLRVVTQPSNVGFLLNCNSAAQQARGKLLLLLNNDVQVTQGWLTALVECYRSDPSVGAVGPKIVYPSGWLQEAGTSLHRDGTSEMLGLNDDPGRPQYSYTRDVDYCSGACLLMSLDDFNDLHGFDTRYAPAYCEDSDLCMRLRERGKRIAYCAESTVVHHLSRTSDGLQNDYKLSCIAANVEQFTQRWRANLDRMDDVRTIAFYLPQFHPIPENDLWWGTGFTEWTNVSKARPNFAGHYQPRMPAELGYYDLRLTEVLEQQAELARRYGIGGFCYYYYWFAGKRLLERPIEQMLESGRPDFPFCLCWANENWTRRWDGNEQDVLMAQHHSDEDDEAVIHDLIRYFRSPNYIRVNGKPLILVYRITLFPNFARTASLWRQACRDAGIGEIYIAQVESFELVTAGIKPSDMGCDAAVEFPPQGMANPYPVTAPLLNPEFSGAVADYRELAARYATREFPAYKRFMGTMPGWDNTARRQNNSYCFENATPGAFQAWLETTIARTKQQYSGDERLVFINAWNEWAEGAYLEPDRRFGHSFLQAHANAKESSQLVRHGKYSLG